MKTIHALTKTAPLLMLLVLVFASCKKTEQPAKGKTPDVVDETVWQPFTPLQFEEKNIIRAHNFGKGIAVGTTKSLVFLSDSLKYKSSYSAGNNANNLAVNPYMDDRVAIYASMQQRTILNIYPLDNPVANYSFDLKTIDPQLSGIYTSRELPICINKAGKMLVVCTKDSMVGNTLYPSGYMHMLFFDMKLNNGVLSPQFDKKVVYIKDTSLLNVKNWPPVISINTDGDNFYVALSGQYYETLKVSTNGDVSSAFPLNITYFIPTKDTIQILGFNNRFELNWGYMLNSFSSGYNISNLGWYNGGWMRFTAIDNRIIGYQGHQMFLFVIDRGTGKYSIRELENKGIELYTQINSIVQIGDKVMVATINGAYTKKLKHFFDFKK